MFIEEIDSAKLFKFYSGNDLEIDENHGYFGTNVKSYAIVENEIVQGAVTISKYGDKSFLEAIAVNKEMRGQGFGKELLFITLPQKKINLPKIKCKNSKNIFVSP